MKFTNIKLADGTSGARPGQGLKRNLDYYVDGAEYGVGTCADSTTTDEDYYIVWNSWPEFNDSGSAANGTKSSDLGDLTNIGITTITARLKGVHVADTCLDMAIIRKSDRKAVRVCISGTNSCHYKNIQASDSNTTIEEIDPKDGPWTPEIGRLVNMGYIG